MALIRQVPGRIFKSSMEEAHEAAARVRAKDIKVAAKVRELTRVEVLGESVFYKTESVIKNTVNFRELPPFQKELAAAMVDVDALRKALHSFGWAGEKVMSLSQEYRRKMRGKMDLGEITALRKQFEKRAESITSQVQRDVDTINRAEKALRRMPSLRKMKTVLIAGYPNVGKSSILNVLSESKVDVQPYPFTTKRLLIGYMRYGYRRYQLVDTPGILDREAKNPIEKQAVAAIRHLSDKVLFVIDPSETCGFSLAQQEELLRKVKESCEVMVVYSKSDLTPHEGISVNTGDPESMAKLKEAIVEWFEK